MTLSLTATQLIGRELAVAWSDGAESYFILETLRLACPCAVCGGEPDVTGKIVRPRAHHTEKSFQLRSWRLVGSYALQLTWADGHDTGLYSYPYLRSLSAP